MTLNFRHCASIKILIKTYKIQNKSHYIFSKNLIDKFKFQFFLLFRINLIDNNQFFFFDRNVRIFKFRNSTLLSS